MSVLIRSLAIALALAVLPAHAADPAAGKRPVRILVGAAPGGPSDVQIRLLLTDMIMPQLGGYELAQRVQQMLPDVRVLLMSGYTDNATLQSGALEKGVIFLQKPFTPAALARSVRQVLDK